MLKKKVFVSGCFDMLHSGHIRFLEKAAKYGDVYLALGSDRTVVELKGRAPVATEAERKYMLEAIRHVKQCLISRGSGIMDFVDELKRVKPDIFIVNEDGNTPAKAALCERLGIQYVVLERDPHVNLPARSTTSLRQECQIPYRLDLAGGWLDQPIVSKHGAGPVLTICLEPTLEFNERSGMASSTRRRAIELWQTDIPQGRPAQAGADIVLLREPAGHGTVFRFAGFHRHRLSGVEPPGLSRRILAGKDYPGGQ